MEVKYSSIEEELRNSGRIVYTSVGVSMMPLLRQKRDLVVIIRYPCDDGRELRKSDAVLFRRGERLVLHRIIDIKEKVYDPADGSEKRERIYVICGDNQYVPEVVKEEQIIGIMTAVVRDGKVIGEDDEKYRRYVERIMKRSMKERRIRIRSTSLLRAAARRAKKLLKPGNNDTGSGQGPAK